MANNKYQKLIRQYSDDGLTWYNLQPIVYKVGELLEEDSYCQARIYREITGDTTSVFDCDENGNKYEMILFQYSDNDGTTWVTYNQQRGNRLENLSEDCGVEYRWIKVLPIETDYICEGTNKYYRIQGEYTINGTDWYAVNQYQKGDLYESNSEDCGYDPDCTGTTYIFNNEYICGSELGTSYEQVSKYEIWKEVLTCDETSFTGNVEYRNPQKSYDCGWVTYQWRVEYDTCGVSLDETITEVNEAPELNVDFE